MKTQRTALQVLESIFLDRSNVPSRLIQEFGADEALCLGRFIARTMANKVHRDKYALEWIRRENRKKWLEDKLEKLLPYEEFVPDDEQRAMPREEFLARHREIRLYEEELAALTSAPSGYLAMIEKVGKEMAYKLIKDVINFFDEDTVAAGKRMNTIFVGASKARNPRAYVAVCLEHERTARLKKQKNARSSRGSKGIQLI